jgi:tRNA pseudouridine13 synthase
LIDEHQDLRFDWSILPAVTSSLPGTAGKIRTCVEDFVVTEIPSYHPSGVGQYAYAFVEKRGLTTHDVVSALRDRGVRFNDVGFAGQKDKHAITRQWFSVPGQFAPELESLDDVDGVRVLETSRHVAKLATGHLKSNRFEVTVREPVPDWQSRAQAVVAELESVGLPNYFGPQRFGMFNSNVIDALRLLRGERVPGGRGMHRFFLSALQSHLFNWNLKRRIELGHYREIISGDRAQKHDTGGMFQVDDAGLESHRARRLEISAALPLHGRKVRPSGGEAGAIEQETLGNFGLSETDLRKAVRGTWRISRVAVRDLSLEPASDGYVINFTLSSGSYATCLLRELLKVDQ